MRFIAGVEHIYHVLGRRDDNMLHAFADRFKDFVLDEGENAVTAYVESPTPQKVIPLHTHTHTHTHTHLFTNLLLLVCVSFTIIN